jgi:hypothetical protein
MLIPAYSIRHRSVATPFLDMSTGGTFARALAAFYFTQAPTDGSSSFLTAASTGVRRSADTRGDGIGASLLMEKAATNEILNSRDLSAASYTAGSGVGTTAAYANGPDGSASGSRSNIASTGFSRYAALTGTANRIFSLWVRNTTTGFHRAAIGTAVSAGAVFFDETAITTTYKRKSAVYTAGGSPVCLSGDGRSYVSVGGAGASAIDCISDLHQAETGYYPTSPIVTTSASVTRPADTLSYASGAYPVGFLTDGVVITFAPDASSAEIVSANEDWRLVENGAFTVSVTGDLVRIRKNGAGCDIDLVCAGVVVATQTVTFSRGQALTITAKPTAGSLTVAGATTGNGTATGTGLGWLAAQTLYIGGDAAGANNVTGRYVGARIVQAV